MFHTQVVEKIKSHILCLITFENRADYVIMWKYIVEPGMPHKTIWRMHNAYWITKATDTHSEYVIRIAIPLQQWLQERASILRHSTLPVLWAGIAQPVRTVDRIPVGARLSATVRTGPGAHPASCTMGTGSFPEVKRPGRSADHPPHSSPEVKERV